MAKKGWESISAKMKKNRGKYKIGSVYTTTFEFKKRKKKVLSYTELKKQDIALERQVRGNAR